MNFELNHAAIPQSVTSRNPGWSLFNGKIQTYQQFGRRTTEQVRP